MNTPSILIWGLTFLSFLFWLICVVHCLRSKTLYRPFDLPPSLTKILWIAFLCTLSITAFLAYALWGVLCKHQENRSSKNHLFHTAGILLFVWMALPLWPSTFLDSPIHLQQISPGVWQEQDATSNADLDIAYHAGSIESNSRNSTTHSVSSFNNAMLCAERIAIITENQHPLLLQSAMAFVDQLKNIEYITHIDVYPNDSLISSGIVLPDIWIRLDMTHLDESQIGPKLNLDANIELNASPTLFSNTHYYSETLTPPSVSFDFTSTLHYTCRSLSIGNPYQLPAGEIAKQLCDAFQKFLVEQKNKHGLLSAEFDEFFPAPPRNPDSPIPFLEEKRPVIFGSRLFTASLAIWRIPCVSDTETTLKTISTELQNAGWRQQFENEIHAQNAYLRYKHGEERLEAFIEKHRQPSGIYRQINDDHPIPTVIAIHTVAMPKEDIDSKLRKIVNEKTSLHFLLAMRQFFWQTNELRDIFKDTLLNHEGNNPERLEELASLWSSSKEWDKHWTALKKAEFLYLAMGNTKKRKDMQKNGQKFEKEHPEFQPPLSEESILAQLGIQPLPDEDEIAITRTVRLNEPLAFYWYDPEGKLQIFSTFMTENTFSNLDCPYALTLHSRGSSSSSSGSQFGNKNQYQWSSGLSYSPFNVRAESQSIDEETFSMTLTIQRDP